MARQRFDLLIVVPLEEELVELLKEFPIVETMQSATQFRALVELPDKEFSALVVQQESAGKSHASRSVIDACKEFEFGLIVCIGIAGGLSSDLGLCSVCYTGTVIDVYDNAKAEDNKKEGGIDLSFAPTHFYTDRKITAAINFMRLMPDLKPIHLAWKTERGKVAAALIPQPVKGRDGRQETIREPSDKDGTVVCSVVSKSEHLNKRLQGIDRKVLAIETESGGVFEHARASGIPALTIRGISDYADSQKNELEGSSKGIVRQLAAANAMSFLRLQFSNPHFVEVLRGLLNRPGFAGGRLS